MKWILLLFLIVLSSCADRFPKNVLIISRIECIKTNSCMYYVRISEDGSTSDSYEVLFFDDHGAWNVGDTIFKPKCLIKK